MAFKTRVIYDHTGNFTRYHETLPQAIGNRSDVVNDASAEILAELLRIDKYARRSDLVAVIHRLQVMRLIVLGLERYLHHGSHYVPHGADKWVERDLTAQQFERIQATFPSFGASPVAEAFRAVTDLAAGMLRELDTASEVPNELWRTLTELRRTVYSQLLSYC